MKKTIAFIPALLLLISALIFTSCNTASGSESETTGIEAEPSDILLPEGVVRLEGDPIELTSDFVIVVADRNSDAAYMLADTIKKKISAKTGFSLERGFTGSIQEKEIVLGYSDNREASDDAYRNINRGEYTVYINGTTLVLGGWNNDTLSAAADLFTDHALVQEDGKWMIYPCALKSESSEPMLSDLSDYRIVYPAKASSFLKNTVIPLIQDKLFSEFGIRVEAVSDSNPASDHEIVVGDTNRTTDTVRAHLGQKEDADLFRYVITSEGMRIYVFAYSDIALHTAANDLCRYTVPEIGPKEFCLRDTPSIAGSPKTSDKNEPAEGADIRIMSYNILHPSWSNVVENVPISGRDINLAKILLYYSPDVAGIQEVNSGWHSAIKKILVDTGYYKQACKMTSDGSKTNMTTFLYNPNTVKLIDEYVLDLQSNSDIRVFSVAVFEKLSDGKRFVVTNSHPAPSSQGENYTRHFAELLKHAQREFEKYKDLPIIMTGDFNTSETHEYYGNLMKTLSFKDAKYDADTLVRRYNTFMSSGWGGFPKQGDNCIDHIFINEHAHAKLFNIVIDHNVSKTSDHLPIYADIELK